MDRGVPIQIQVHDGRSRPDRRPIILDALHHENHATRADRRGSLMGPQQRALQESGVEARQLLVIGAVQRHSRDAERRARLVHQMILTAHGCPQFCGQAGQRVRGVVGRILGAIQPEGLHRPVRRRPRGAGRRARCAGHTPRSGRRAAGAGWDGVRRARRRGRAGRGRRRPGPRRASLFQRARAQEGGGHAGVRDRERHRQVGQRQAGLVRDRDQLLHGVDAALVAEVGEVLAFRCAA